MFWPYRTLKLKVPRPCCPWCQTHSERIEQKLQALENQIQELSTKLATSREAENVSAGFLTALQVFGLTSSPQRTAEGPQSESAYLVRAFSAIIAALDRLAGAPASPGTPDLVTASTKNFIPSPAHPG